MRFPPLTSPKNAGTRAYAQSRSLLAPLYGRQSTELMVITPEVRRVLDLTPKGQFTGSFALGAFKTFARVFNDGRSAQYTGRQRLEVICTYKIENALSGSVYVGATPDFFKRWGTHCRLLRRAVHTNIRLQEEFDVYGEDAFTITIIESYGTTDGLIEREERATKEFDPARVLNYFIGRKARSGWCTRLNQGMGRATRPTKAKRGPQSVYRWFDSAYAKEQA